MFVVTLPASAEKHPLLFARKAKKSGADILEIRADLTPRVRPFAAPLPILLALRGRPPSLIAALDPTYLDLELQEKVLDRFIPEGVRIIRSFHDYRSTPSLAQLRAIVKKLNASRPHSVKIAVLIRRYADLKTLVALSRELRRQKIPATVLGMGDKAHLPRALSGLHNVFTYACLDGASASAPGQLPLSFYRSIRHLRSPVLFGILGGRQVKASLSPAIHNLLYRQKKFDALYTRFPTDDLADAWRSIEMLGVRGISVTAPFKRKILTYADAADPVAKKLESANTLVHRENGTWMAYNTDAVGFLHGYPILKKARTVAVLGAGGVVPAVLLALKQLCPSATVTVYARSPERAAGALGNTHPEVRSLHGLKAATADVIICAISEDIAFTLPRPTGIACAIDLRYGSITRFMKMAKRKRYTVSDGLKMLVHQALAQHELFTGNHVSPAAVSSLFSLLSSLPPSTHGK